jgi:hypothetical protein
MAQSMCFKTLKDVCSNLPSIRLIKDAHILVVPVVLTNEPRFHPTFAVTVFPALACLGSELLLLRTAHAKV